MTATPQDENEPVRNMPLTVHAQYIKDLSFENPNAPQILRATGGQPGMQLGINVGVVAIDDKEIPGLVEVSLRIKASGTRDNKPAFIAEIEYAAAVTIGEGVPEEAKHPLLMIEVPRLLFPFSRQLLSQLSQQGGYPALFIAPVDFQALYIQKFAKELDAIDPARAAAN